MNIRTIIENITNRIQHRLDATALAHEVERLRGECASLNSQCEALDEALDAECELLRADRDEFLARAQTNWRMLRESERRTVKALDDLAHAHARITRLQAEVSRLVKQCGYWERETHDPNDARNRLERDMLRIARALGRYHEADGHNDKPADIDTLVKRAEELSEAERDFAEFEADITKALGHGEELIPRGTLVERVGELGEMESELEKVWTDSDMFASVLELERGRRREVAVERDKLRERLRQTRHSRERLRGEVESEVESGAAHAEAMIAERDEALDEVTRLNEQVRELLGWNHDQLCVQCRKLVEPDRRCFAHPTCHACLPPPEPLAGIDEEASGLDQLLALRAGVREIANAAGDESRAWRTREVNEVNEVKASSTLADMSALLSALLADQPTDASARCSACDYEEREPDAQSPHPHACRSSTWPPPRGSWWQSEAVFDGRPFVVEDASSYDVGVRTMGQELALRFFTPKGWSGLRPQLLWGQAQPILSEESDE